MTNIDPRIETATHTIIKPQDTISMHVEAWKTAMAEWDKASREEAPKEAFYLQQLNLKLPDWRERSEEERQAVLATIPEYAEYKALNEIQIKACARAYDAIDAILACPVFLLEDIKIKAEWIKSQYNTQSGCIEDSEEVAKALIKSFTDIDELQEMQA